MTTQETLNSTTPSKSWSNIVLLNDQPGTSDIEQLRGQVSFWYNLFFEDFYSSLFIGFEYQRALKMFQCFHARDFSIQTRLNYNYIVCPLNQKLPIVQGLSLDRLWNLGSWDGNLHIDSDRRHWLNSCYKISKLFITFFEWNSNQILLNSLTIQAWCFSTMVLVSVVTKERIEAPPYISFVDRQIISYKLKSPRNASII